MLIHTCCPAALLCVRCVQVPVSIVATGMGTPMMDFVVRETRAVVDGPMAMLRYGTCGGVRDTPVGTVVVASDGTVLIRREADIITKRLATPGVCLPCTCCACVWGNVRGARGAPAACIQSLQRRVHAHLMERVCRQQGVAV